MRTGTLFSMLVDEVEALLAEGEYEPGLRRVENELRKDHWDLEERALLLGAKARFEARLGRVPDALATMRESVIQAHASQSARTLVGMLDQLAEMRCMDEDFQGALVTLAEVDRYLAFVGEPTPELTGNIAHTRGMAYAGCGLWDQSQRYYEKAIETFAHWRMWMQWTGAAGDFAIMAIAEAEAEGPRPERLKAAAAQLVRLAELCKNNPAWAVLAAMHQLRIRSLLAFAASNAAELEEVVEAYPRLRQAHLALFLRDDGFDRMLEWTNGAAQAVWMLVQIDPGNRLAHPVIGLMSSIVEEGTRIGPRVASLWHRLALLRLCQAEASPNRSEDKLRAAASCLATCTDICRTNTNQLDAPMRAGVNMRLSGVSEAIARTAWQSIAQGAGPGDIVPAMYTLLQFSRARTRRDVTGTAGRFRHTAGLVADLLSRTSQLDRWIAHMDAVGYTADTSIVRDATTAGMLTLDQVATEVCAQFPEYAKFNQRQELEGERTRVESELAHESRAQPALNAHRLAVEDEGPFDLGSVQRRLGANEAIVDYHVGPYAAHIMLVSQRGIDVYRVPVPPRTLRVLIERSLQTRSRQEPTVRLDHESYDNLSAWLWPRELVRALLELNTGRLFVVPCGPLWAVPFGLLRAGDKLAIVRWEICVTPCARLAGSAEAHAPIERAVVLGTPRPDLTNVLTEVTMVRDLLNARVFARGIAGNATRTAAREALASADAVHFACHGEVNAASPPSSHLLLEPDEERKDDGRLFMSDVLATPNHAHVVNLAACHSLNAAGATTFPETLAHATLGAGARFTVASLWEADDEQCLRFGQSFYRAHRNGYDTIDSFSRAVRDLLKPLSSKDSIEVVTLTGNFVLLGAIPTS